MKIDRLLSTVLLLLNREKITAQELAAHFETSIRTVYRDIETLALAGIPILSEQGAGGGYSLLPNFKLDRQVFTPNELLALITGLKGVQTAFKDQAVASAVEKINALVPELAKAPKAVAIDFSSWEPTAKQQETMSNLYKSILTQQRVKFEYINLQGKTTSRTVEPIRLLFRGSAWYLIGYCLLKTEYRWFKVARLNNLQVLEEHFHEHQLTEEDLKLHVHGQTAPVVELHLRFPASARGRLFGYVSNDELTRSDVDSFEVHTRYPLDEWVYSFLLGLADVVEVLAPAFVRDELLRRMEIFRKKNSKLTTTT